MAPPARTASMTLSVRLSSTRATMSFSLMGSAPQFPRCCAASAGTLTRREHHRRTDMIGSTLANAISPKPSIIGFQTPNEENKPEDNADRADENLSQLRKGLLQYHDLEEGDGRENGSKIRKRTGETPYDDSRNSRFHREPPATTCGARGPRGYCCRGEHGHCRTYDTAAAASMAVLAPPYPAAQGGIQRLRQTGELVMLHAFRPARKERPHGQERYRNCP